MGARGKADAGRLRTVDDGPARRVYESCPDRPKEIAKDIGNLNKHRRRRINEL